MLVGCVASKNNSKESIKSILWLALFTGSLCFNYFFLLITLKKEQICNCHLLYILRILKKM